MTDKNQATASFQTTAQHTPLNPALFMSLAPDTCQLFSLMNPSFIPGQGLIVQFISANLNEGVSTVARDFALTAVQHIEGSVLLLDFDWGRDSHLTHFQQVLKQQGRDTNLPQLLNLDIDLNPLLRVSVQPDAGPPLKFHGLPETQFILGRRDTSLCNVSKRVPCVLNRPNVWAALRRQFMLTVVDSPPSCDSFDGIAISGSMDAVVLVVRAESTRTPVLENLRDRLIAQHAPLVGLVLNQRRFYIPKLIYRFLDRL